MTNLCLLSAMNTYNTLHTFNLGCVFNPNADQNILFSLRQCQAPLLLLFNTHPPVAVLAVVHSSHPCFNTPFPPPMAWPHHPRGRWPSRCTWASPPAWPTGARRGTSSPSSWRATRWWTLWSCPTTTTSSSTPTCCAGSSAEPWRWWVARRVSHAGWFLRQTLLHHVLSLCA